MGYIDHVEVYLEAQENTTAIYRIHSVISYDSKDNEIKNYQELAYVDEFNGSDGDYEQEVVDYVASKVGVDKDIVEIKGYI
ncbi:hypothetical protein SPSIL_058170 [Sporomusa silvacetica DSM 10669]|uniref:Uncharacterized protein n=1 Tax=Sporomusa silvacetica DSM 10669 TaxID=1123289 RepID=A0ABZ3IW40_9FIRM|nr:hypothetical protein [Sporomusa silvacetica]OZC14235.1 hypothetical protein SPSIL_49620 [Sporomusa silvacetica DSM 10669]